MFQDNPNSNSANVWERKEPSVTQFRADECLKSSQSSQTLEFNHGIEGKQNKK